MRARARVAPVAPAIRTRLVRVRAAIVVFAFLGLGCRFVSTSIRRVVQEPHKYQGAEVTVSGRVAHTRWLPEVGATGFSLTDGADSLLVLTLTNPPPAGTSMRLQGRLLRRFPMGGTERMVLLYRIDPDDERLVGTTDTR